MELNKTIQQLHRKRIEQYLAEGTPVSGGVNSTAIVTDLTTVIANISAAQQNRGAGGSPVANVVADSTALVNLLKLKAQEMKSIMNYLLYGDSRGSGSGNTQGGTQALFQTGDSNAANTTTLLINVFNDLG